MFVVVDNYTINTDVVPTLDGWDSGVDVLYDNQHFMRIGGGKGALVLALAKEISRLREQPPQGSTA